MCIYLDENFFYCRKESLHNVRSYHKTVEQGTLNGLFSTTNVNKSLRNAPNWYNADESRINGIHFATILENLKNCFGAYCKTIYKMNDFRNQLCCFSSNQHNAISRETV